MKINSIVDSVAEIAFINKASLSNFFVTRQKFPLKRITVFRQNKMSDRSQQPSFSHIWRDINEEDLKEIISCKTSSSMKKYN